MSVTMGTINLSDILERDYTDIPEDQQSRKKFEPIPRGTYDAEVVSTELITSKKGNQYINFQFRVTTGEYANRIVWHRLMLMESWHATIVETFEALGKEESDDSYTPGEFDGVPCQIRVSIQEQQNYDPRNVVNRVQPPRDDYDENSSSWL